MTSARHAPSGGSAPTAMLLTEHRLAQWATRFAAGDAPSALPYGIDALRELGWRLTAPATSPGRLASKVRSVAEHRAGLILERPLRGLALGHRADVAIALLEREGMLPALLKGARIPPYAALPLVLWSCWLADDFRRAPAAERRRLLARIRHADLITHLSRHESEIFLDAGIPADRLFCVTYGVSHEFYTPGPHGAADPERDIEILAVGQDRGRDHRTLVEAVRGRDLPLDLVTRPDTVADLDLPPNVRFHGTVPLAAYRSMLRRARVVAVPTRDLAYPTGSSVALEAAASGCAVVVTGTRAMRDYFVDGRSARFVPEGDVSGWREVLHELRDDASQRARLGAGGRASVVERFNARHMWRELAEVMAARGLLGDPPPPTP